MKYSILFAIGLAMILPLQAADKGAKAKQCPKASPERAFKRKDKDHDNMLTKEEFTAKAKDAAKAGERFTKRDKNSDGSLTLAEFSGKRAKTGKTKPAGAKKAGGKKAGGKKAGGKKAGGRKAAKKAERAQQNK